LACLKDAHGKRRDSDPKSSQQFRVTKAVRANKTLQFVKNVRRHSNLWITVEEQEGN